VHRNHYQSKYIRLRKLLILFSYVFHPIFVSVFGALLYFYLIETEFNKFQQFLIICQISIITIFIPITFFYILKMMGKIDSVMASQIPERKIPLIGQAILLYVLFTKSITHGLMMQLHFFFIGGMISAIIAFLFLFFKIKSSLHMLGTSSLLAFAIGLSSYNQSNNLLLISSIILLNGLVATSRLEMKAHTYKELIIGFFIGLLPQIMVWKFWL
jgi:hypothetical protein